MAREWQQTKFKEYVMPDPVYYQSLWAVRDLERMEVRLEELKREKKACSSSLICEGKNTSLVSRPTENHALEMAILEERINAIRDALTIVPESYRAFVLSNIIFKTSGKGYPNKLWRVWKQRFLYQVAKNLSIM